MHFFSSFFSVKARMRIIHRFSVKVFNSLSPLHRNFPAAARCLPGSQTKQGPRGAARLQCPGLMPAWSQRNARAARQGGPRGRHKFSQAPGQGEEHPGSLPARSRHRQLGGGGEGAPWQARAQHGTWAVGRGMGSRFQTLPPPPRCCMHVSPANL